MTAPTPIADMITEMLKNCIPIEMIIAAVRSMEHAMSTRRQVDEMAEKRRAWDREYRRNKRATRPPDPPDIHPNPPDVGNDALFLSRDNITILNNGEKKEKKQRGCKLPVGWTPKQSHYDEGAKRGLSPMDVDERADNMRTWCAANANRSITTKADWDATFMGFIRRDSNGQATNGHRAPAASRPAATSSDAILAGMGRIADRIAARKLAERQDGDDLAGDTGPERRRS